MKLNNFKIKNLPLNKKVSDGGGLNLTLSSRDKGKWTFRYSFDGKSREMGIGSYPEISLAEARNITLDKRRLKSQNVDPIHERRVLQKIEQEKSRRRFSHIAKDYIEDNKDAWKNPKHTQQWHNTLRQYAFPILDEVPFHAIKSDHVFRVLKPIWYIKSETASRIQQRIARIMGYGISREYYVGSNIADWRTNIKFLLKKPFREPKHHPSLHYSKLPDFYDQLCEIDTTAARALRFAILTVARTSEVTLMSYGEVDLDKKNWTIPGERMKAHREHRVPLSEEALIVLDIVNSKHNYFHIFQGHKPDTPLSNNAMGKFVRDKYRHMKFTVHGFRSTFRDWAAETGNYDQNMVEFALAHQLPTRSQAAYFRSDLFDKRRILMDDWAEFVTSKKNKKSN